MGMQETNRIDAITKAPDGKLALAVFDTLDWDDAATREECFMAKLGFYRRYVESGAFAEKFPNVAPTDVRIVVTCRTPPTGVMRDVHLVEGGNGSGAMPVEFMQVADPPWMQELNPILEAIGSGHTPRTMSDAESTSREGACPRCRGSFWHRSEPRDCTFVFKDLGEQQVRKVRCRMCKRCGTFVPDATDNDGQPECGKMDKPMSTMKEFTFRYPETGETKQHLLMAMKLKCCDKMLIIGAPEEIMELLRRKRS